MTMYNVMVYLFVSGVVTLMSRTLDSPVVCGVTRTRKERTSLFPSNPSVHSSDTHLDPKVPFVKLVGTSGTSVTI